jgi:hypothetical protein
MGLSLDFSMTDDQKKIAVGVGIGGSILLVLVLYFLLRGPGYDTALLKDLENSGRPATKEDLEKLSPLLSHPDQKVRESTARYFTGAAPAVVSDAVRSSRNLDARSRRILEARYLENAPAEAVQYLVSELSGAARDRAEDIYVLLGQAKTPDAAPYVLQAAENGPDETIRSQASSAIAQNKALQNENAKAGLERIINDPNRSQRERAHALRARNAMSGKPYSPGMSPDGRPLQGGSTGSGIGGS